MSRRRRRCWKWVDFSFLQLFNFWHRFSTDTVEYSPRARMRWAWGRTQRWSTWWRWSSCRRAGLAGREGLRQTKYRKGQNTDEEGIEMCPKLLLFLGAVDIDRKVIEFDKLMCGPILRPGLFDSWCKRQFWLFFSGQFFPIRGWGNFCANTQFKLSGFAVTLHQYKTREAELLRKQRFQKTSVFSQNLNGWGAG